jgi:adenine deaminase
LLARAVSLGISPLKALRAACRNPMEHYRLGLGLLRVGDPADFIILSDLQSFEVLESYRAGIPLIHNHQAVFSAPFAQAINHFVASKISSADLVMRSNSSQIRVIEFFDGQLTTAQRIEASPFEMKSEVSRDILKLVVVNRYQKAAPAVAFVHGFGLKRGAIASTVAHDCHNIIAVGVDDQEIVAAINCLMDSKGGIVAVHASEMVQLSLPVAGLISLDEGHTVAKKYEALNAAAKRMGTTLQSPFMTLSFLALLVIPKLKLSDRGLFDGESFRFVSLGI